MIEFPDEFGASPAQPAGAGHGPSRAGAATETEVWLRRELAFLHRVERRILRRERWRREAWRGIVVACILSIFALCWYLAALATGPAHHSCPGKATSTATAQHSGTAASAAKSGTNTSSGATASCDS